MYRYIGILVAAVLLQGCAIGNPIENRQNDTVSFVAAYVDMEGLDAPCDGGSLLNIDNSDESEVFWTMMRAPGKNQWFLYSKAVEPGRYTIQSIDTFYMLGASHGVTTRIMLPENGVRYGVYNIKKQGIYYLGAYKVKKDRDGNSR